MLPLLPASAGVYGIRAPSGNLYVGSAKNMRRRIVVHRYQLLSGIHPNNRLQSAFNKYAGALTVELLADCPVEQLMDVEQTFIDSLRPAYNISREARRPQQLPDTPQKISAALKGRPKSEETKAKLRAAALGRKASDETRAKMSASGRGKKRSPEQIARMSAAAAKYRHTEETKKKLSLIKLNGRPPKEKTPGLGRGRGSPGYPKPRGPWPQWVKDKIGASLRKRQEALRAEKETQPC